MKCLFLSAKRYSIHQSVLNGLKANGWQVSVADYQDFFHPKINLMVNRLSFLPNKVKGLWVKRYLKSINEEYIRIFKSEKPDLIFIYNNQLVFPETISFFKQNKAKIAFILGDHPLYTPTNPYNLHILFQADYIISPDTFWMHQLNVLGIKNIHFDCFGFDSESYYPFKPSVVQLKKHSSDLVYVGQAHKGSWGYKRFHFLNQFASFNLRTYMNGNAFQAQWSEFFPDLLGKIIEHNRYDSAFNNLVYNCSKISPIEQVPALFHGVHIRVFDVLGAGIFPLCEYSKDLEKVFYDINVPYIKNYSEAESVAKFLLNNEKERIDLIQKMRNRVLENHHPQQVLSRLIESVYKT